MDSEYKEKHFTLCAYSARIARFLLNQRIQLTYLQTKLYSFPPPNLHLHINASRWWGVRWGESEVDECYGGSDDKGSGLSHLLKVQA